MGQDGQFGSFHPKAEGLRRLAAVPPLSEERFWLYMDGEFIDGYHTREAALIALHHLAVNMGQIVGSRIVDSHAPIRMAAAELAAGSEVDLPPAT